MYKVIKFFTDLHDNDRSYNVGDTFPREGIEVTKSRLAELSSEDNKQGVPLIELVEEEAETKEPPKEEPPKEEPEPPKRSTRKANAK